MTSKFKPGDKVWVKGVVLPSSAKGNCVFVEVVDITGEDAAIPLHCSKLRHRVKRKKPASPWQPIETAPKDGTPVLARLGQPRGADWTYRGGWEYEVARFLRGGWCVGGNEPMRDDPTHWMPIPPLEVE